MSTSAAEIVELWKRRREAAGVMLQRAQELRDAYNGDVVVPLPELDKTERSAVANLVAVGLDQQAMRIASTVPDVYYPPLKPGKDQSERYARIRRRANLGWWEMNRQSVNLRRRARYLIGYASSPVVIRPDRKRGIPLYQKRDPLSCYPAPTADPDDLTPPDCIFGFSRTLQWIGAHYPEQRRSLRVGADPKPDDLFSIVEYVDEFETVLVCVGRERMRNDFYVPPGSNVGENWVELERVENRTDLCPAVVPGRVTLDRRQGKFDGILGMYQNQAKLMALEYIAVKKGIFPDTWLVGRPNETPNVTTTADGLRGIVGVVKGGVIQEVGVNPGFMTNPTIDRYERYQRVTAGIPAELGGESTGNVRTGRRGDSILSAVLDFDVQEAQEMLAASLMEENRRAVAVAKAWWPDRPRSFYVSAKGAIGRVDYVPSKHFESDENTVSYPHAGADANALVIGLGQRVGIGTMSKRTAQEIDPMVADPELEHDRTQAEGLEQSLLTAIEQQVAAGQIGPAEVAKIMDAVSSDKLSLADAVMQIHDEMQQAQATSGEPGTPTGPVEPGAPEAQAGLGGPDQAGVAVGPPQPSVENLGNLLASLRKPTRQTPGERQAVPA